MFATPNIEDNQFMKNDAGSRPYDNREASDRDPLAGHRQAWGKALYGPAGLSIPQYRPIDQNSERSYANLKTEVCLIKEWLICQYHPAVCRAVGMRSCPLRLRSVPRSQLGKYLYIVNDSMSHWPSLSIW